jgi:hypothetical protein
MVVGWRMESGSPGSTELDAPPKGIQLRADCPLGDLLEQHARIVGCEPARELVAFPGFASPEPAQVLGLRARMHKTGRARGVVARRLDRRRPCSWGSMSPKTSS